MQGPTTLQGIFPDRKVVYRRNFIKENMRRIKQMQEVMQGISEPRISGKVGGQQNHHQQATAQRTVPTRVSRTSTTIETTDAKAKSTATAGVNTATPRRPGIQKLEILPKKEEKKNAEQDRITHRAMQTEATDNVQQIYATGIIKFPSAYLMAMTPRNKPPKKTKDQGHGDSALNEDKTVRADYIKQNMAMKARNMRQNSMLDPNQPPPNYKRGVVPKYLKQKKPTVVEEDDGDVDCPSGHVLLPEEERKETLRVLRESYAEKIQELNAMPVRSDTLRMQRRKMELEEDLKKIDEGIKVFQRPKVFVKINV